MHAVAEVPAPVASIPTREDFERLSATMVRELRSDHAGETGAVSIYRGILAVSRDPTVIAFAREHLETEERHLEFFESQLPDRMKTRLRGLCGLAGWLTGALPALFGPSAIFATIDAVETFVDEHYRQQIEALDPDDQPRLRATLESFRADEVEHRDDASSRSPGPKPALLRLWCAVVDAGSKAGVVVARRI